MHLQNQVGMKYILTCVDAYFCTAVKQNKKKRFNPLFWF